MVPSTAAAAARTAAVKRSGLTTAESTPLGKSWKKRLDASENYFKAHSRDWKALEKLYSDVYTSRNRWGAGVSIAWSVVNNLVIDSYVRNPEPMIVSLQQQARPDFDRMVRDLFKAIHRDSDLEGVMKRSMVLGHLHGYAGVWTYHEQIDRFEQRMVPFEPEDEVDLIEGQRPMGKVLRFPVAAKQRICHEDVPAIDLRHDPNGAKWDLSDHQWVARIYTRPLQWFIDEFNSKGERSGFTADGIRRLTAWARGNRSKRRPGESSRSSGERYTETDPSYMPVSVFEIWTRADYKVIHVPVGAEFEIGEYDWPEEWRASNEFPLTIVAFNKDVPTDTDTGFYPIPTLRLIRSHLENINRIMAMWLESTSIAIKKYVTLKGLTSDENKSQLQTDKSREIIEIDISKLRKVFPDLASSFANFDISKILTLLKQDDGADAQRWLLVIQNELSMIAQVIGQGSAARGGVPDAESATATMTIAERMAARTAETGEQAAKIVDRIDEKTYYILQQRQTLPIPYQLSTSRGPEVYAFFPPEVLEGVQLVFSHRNGSTRAMTKDQMRKEIQQFATIALPTLQAEGMKREINLVMREWLKFFDMDIADGMFLDEVPELAREVMGILQAIRDDPEKVQDMRVSAALVSAAAKLADAVSSPADIQAVADKSLEGMSASPGASAKGQGSMRQISPGQNAAGAAAAGAVGGMASGGSA